MKTIGGILLGIVTIIYWQYYYSNLYKFWMSVKSNPDDAMEKKALLIRNIIIQIIMAGLGLFLIISTLQILGFVNYW
jgi:hypothetical protein